MLSQFTAVFLLTTGLPPAEMANVVADRMARLDKLVVEVDAELYNCANTFSPTDRSNWVDPGPPGDGGRRLLRIVRPGLFEESFVDGQPMSILSSFEPGRSVRRAPNLSPSGRIFYSVEDNPVTAGYTRIPLLQMFDVQIHESWVPGLNILRLLRDYPATLTGSDGEISTYEVSLRSDLPGASREHYEFDLNPRGTPLRFRTRLENPAGTTYESTTYTLATIEINGAELVTEAVTASTNTYTGPLYGITRLVVRSARVDEALTARDVRLEPERRNSFVWTRTLNGSSTALVETKQEYDEAGVLVASTRSAGTSGLAWHGSIFPVAAAFGAATALGVALVSRPRRSA